MPTDAGFFQRPAPALPVAVEVSTYFPDADALVVVSTPSGELIWIRQGITWREARHAADNLAVPRHARRYVRQLARQRLDERTSPGDIPPGLALR